jgi:hypothetical protein
LSLYSITRARASLAAIVAACVWAAGASAGGGPGDVYNDYAADGVLSCNHSRADLVALLRSGSLNQYGDPYTLARVKLAARKQLAGGCRHGGRSRQDENDSAGTPGGTGGQTGGGQSNGSAGHKRQNPPGPPPEPLPGAAASAAEDNASFVMGRGLIVAALAAALAFGGWLTKRGMAARD